jgi:hypothetical protein
MVPEVMPQTRSRGKLDTRANRKGHAGDVVCALQVAAVSDQNHCNRQRCCRCPANKIRELLAAAG